MPGTANLAPMSKSQLWTGRVLSALAVLFLIFDSVLKLIKPAMVVEGTVKLGYSASMITPLGIVALLRRPVLHPGNARPRRYPSYRLSRWRRCHPRSRWRSAVFPCTFPDLRRVAPVARTLLPRSGAAFVCTSTKSELTAMCRNIRTLFNFDPPVTDDEVRAASLQFVRKITGFNKPSKANEQAFQAAIDEIAGVSNRLLRSLETSAPPKNREEEAAKAKARAAERFAN
jgi:hypothetical protein